MNGRITKSEIQQVETTNLTPIEIVLGIDEEGRTTAKKLYEFLELAKGQFSRWAKTNILENQFATNGEDYQGFDTNVEGNKVMDYKLSASFAKKLAMGTHNFKGEAAKEYFVKVEDRLKQKCIDASQLSPETQLLLKLSQSIANNELEQRKLHQGITEAKQQAVEAKEEVQAIRDVVEIRPSQNWRNETNNFMKKICYKLSDYKTPKDEVYKALQERAGCSLKIRLENMRARLLLNGGSKTKADNLNYLDVIAEDKKLIEIYTTIVKEMAIKYKVV